MQEEVDTFSKLMRDMDADIVKILPATQKMMQGTLEAALNTDYPAYEQPPLGQRRAMVLSGMYGSEVVEVIAAYNDSGGQERVGVGQTRRSSL